MLKLISSRKFQKDLKRMLKRGKDEKKIHQIVKLLRKEEPLPPAKREHHLTGN